MIFSYNWLQSFFKKRLPQPKQLADLLTMHSFEVSQIEKRNNDFALDIDILPNRGPDCFSHWGIAREISAILNLRLENPNLKPSFKAQDLKVEDFISVEVKDRQACQRYTAGVFTDLKVGPSPKWMRERLETCGLRAINNIVDIANYVMLEIGQPLHAFDGEKIEEKKIVVRFAKKAEKIITLDDERYELDEKILVIADAQKPIAIAGIKGGKEAGIDSKTKTMVLESANFNSQVIRQGSKLIDLKTDASWRFEHGLDPNLTEIAIKRAQYLIQEIAGGKVAQDLIDFYPQKIFPKKIKLDFEQIERLLGLKISLKKVIEILKNLNFKVSYQLTKLKTYQLLVEVPSFRLDISLPEDLIEEIARVYGYEKILPVFPLASLLPPKKNLDIFWENLTKDILKEIGFSEIHNYSFISQKDAEIFKYENQELVEVENPVSLEYQYLRPSLIPNLLKNVAKNQRWFSQIKIFELGKIFQKGFKEKKVLTGVITGEAFSQTKGIVDLLLNKLGISNIWYDEYQATPEESKISIWQPGKTAEIKVDHQEIGFLGKISPSILENLKIENSLFVFDIDFERLSQLASEEHEYQPISRFPAAIRDLAILVPRETRVEEVLNKIEIAGGYLIRDIDLFDIYEGEGLPEGKKSLAFHIIYQAQERTLTSEEIDEIQNKIIKILENEPEWEVRK